MARIGSSRKLDENRWKQVVKFLFIDVPEVEVEIRYRGCPSIAQGHDVLDDRRTERKCQFNKVESVEERRTGGYFYLIPLQRQEMIRGSGLRTVRLMSNIRFPCIHKNEPVDFH